MHINISKVAFYAGIAGFFFGTTLPKGSFDRCMNSIIQFARSGNTISFSMLPQKGAETTEHRDGHFTPIQKFRARTYSVLAAEENDFFQPLLRLKIPPREHDPKVNKAPEERYIELAELKKNSTRQNERSQKGIQGIRIAGDSLSVNVKNVKLLKLFEDLETQGGIHIFGKHVLSGKVISTKFDAMTLEQAIKHLVRSAGIENYALMYRKDQGNRYVLTGVFFAEGGKGVQNQEMNHPSYQQTVEPDYRPEVELETETLPDDDNARKGNVLKKKISHKRKSVPSKQLISADPTTNMPRRFLGLEIKYPDQ